MRPLIITFIFALFAFKGAFAQLSIINDPDGYVNVREGKSLKAKVIGKLFEREIFLCDDEDSKDDWLWVAFDSKNFTVFNSDQKNYSNVENDIKSFVHRSRVIHLYSLPKPHLAKTWLSNHNTLILQNDSIKISISKAVFVAKNHHINFSKAGEVLKIDGKTPIGEDGGMPKYVVHNIELKINGVSIDLPPNSYVDLYQPKLNNFNIHYDKNGNIYLLMAANSDGAGGYDVVWVISHHKLVARYFDSLG
jgi:hypothetical protein